MPRIYERVKEILYRHAPPFKVSGLAVRGKEGTQLVTPKPVILPGAYGGRPVDLQFAAAIPQKGYVGFYLMCIYMDEGAKSQLSPALRKLSKGKTCFQLKALDAGLEKDIEAALSLGTKAYRERGWVQA